MLKQRLLTAIIILPLFLAGLLYLPPIFWAAVLLILTVIGSREWSRLAQFSVKSTTYFMLGTALLGGELLFMVSEATKINVYSQYFLWLYVLSFIFWIIVVPLLLKRSQPINNTAVLMFIGWLLLFPICLALYQLREINPYLLLGFMGTIWVSDTAAYFTGRAFGKHKLAAIISPGKTWEGVAGALAAVLLYAVLWHQLTTEQPLTTILIPLLMLLAILGIIGDLFESQMKRHAGIKDSGTILPGHGGILDRIDALTSTLPVAMMALLVFHAPNL